MSNTVFKEVTFYRISVGNLWFDVCGVCHSMSVDNPAHIQWHRDLIRAIRNNPS